MITVEPVTKTYGAFTAADAGIQIFTERFGQAIFGTHVLAGDLALDRNEDGITNPTGRITNQPHLHGVPTKFRDLGVTRIAVTPAGLPQTATEKE